MPISSPPTAPSTARASHSPTPRTCRRTCASSWAWSPRRPRSLLRADRPASLGSIPPLVLGLAAMTDQTATSPDPGAHAAPPPAAPEAPAFDPMARAKELAILDALRTVVDPEIGMNVVELALINQILTR